MVRESEGYNAFVCTITNTAQNHILYRTLMSNFINNPD